MKSSHEMQEVQAQLDALEQGIQDLRQKLTTEDSVSSTQIQQAKADLAKVLGDVARVGDVVACW
ncbi:hypothetical protein PS838_01449 [Pseudomonas fluorescens]|nr:hypothetical protein PS838_01449 [Pseudomonas fluorescens]